MKFFSTESIRRRLSKGGSLCETKENIAKQRLPSKDKAPLGFALRNTEAVAALQSIEQHLDSPAGIRENLMCVAQY